MVPPALGESVRYSPADGPGELGIRRAAAGDNIDDILHDVMNATMLCRTWHRCAVALWTEPRDAGTLPLVTSQRIWDWDINREERIASVSAQHLIGFEMTGGTGINAGSRPREQ